MYTDYESENNKMGLGTGDHASGEKALGMAEARKWARRAWQTKFRANGKVALGESLNADGFPVPSLPTGSSWTGNLPTTKSTL